MILIQNLQMTDKNEIISEISKSQKICTYFIGSYIVMDLILFYIRRLSETYFVMMVTFGVVLLFLVFFLPNLEKFKINIGVTGFEMSSERRSLEAESRLIGDYQSKK